ncbi:MAG: Type II secretion system protein E [Parcubacteria group bacterium Gr01-1014_20]|nr:MAG: Type II secretion system protein E [Parcubacteria group bacterium Gr01-1014_20]
MELDDQKIKDVLSKQGHISPEDIKKAEEFGLARGVPLVEYFLEKGLITRSALGQAIAQSFGIAYADLSSNEPPREQVLKISEDTAKKRRSVIFREDDKTIVIATDNPSDAETIKELSDLFKSKQIILSYSFPEDINHVLVNYRQTLGVRFEKIISDKKRIAPEIIDEIIEDALAIRASDIHIEPMEKDVLIRFRVDGVLREVGRIPKEYYENILNRIKVQAHLRIDEHFAAQDGAIRYLQDGKAVDLRIAITPTLDGEKVAVRLLAEYVRGFTLADLGLSPGDQKILQESSRKPFGMILVTGPTGSGKTTTLYSLIKILNRPEINITTIEDPVEYKIVGVNQIQVNRQTDLTFSKGLPSILRQDPDVVLVGEIRGPDTAEIAVNAALTGHLLLSTFHANDAATAIPRLLDMGVEPFLVASTLELIVAQRLVRKICENCRTSETLSPLSLSQLIPSTSRYFANIPSTFFKGKGCSSCTNTGYRGRTAIFEFIKITKEMQDLILGNPSNRQISQLARSQGAHSLFEDGLEKVKNGVTTLEELIRVASPKD